MSKQTNEPFGEAVHQLMKDEQVTYRGLAAKTGLSGGYLNHIVHGNRPVPATAGIEAISEALGVDPSYFVEERLRVVTAWLTHDTAAMNKLYAKAAAALTPA